MSRCQCCGEWATWAWQPFGPGETVDVFTLLGNHYRGYKVVRVCQSCKAEVQGGAMVTFTVNGEPFYVNDKTRRPETCPF